MRFGNEKREMLAAMVVSVGLGAGTTHSADHYFGMLHTEIGQATLQSNPDGTLTVDNLGSSGCDGVSIDAGGGVSGFAVGLDLGPAGALPASAKVAVYNPAPDWCTSCGSCIEVFERSGGDAGVCYMSTGPAPTCVRVELRLNGQVVDTREFPQPIPANLVSGALGTVGNLTLEVRVNRIDMAIIAPQPTLLTLTQSPVGPIMADTIVVIPEGLPPGEYYVAASPRITARDIPGGLRILHEGVRLLDSATGSCCRQVRAEGDAHIAALDPTELCAGLPEFCDELQNAPQPPTGLRVSNLGSSGCDGVSIIVDDDDDSSSDDLYDDLFMHVTPIDVSGSGGAVYMEATGTLSGQPDRLLGTVQFESGPVGVEVRADYAAVGSPDVLVEVRDNGVLVGSVQLQGGPQVVLGTLSGATGVRINKCGKFGGAGVGPPCFAVCTDEPFLFDSGAGVTLSGNDLRLLSSPVGTVDEISTLTMRCSGPPDVTAGIAPPPTAPETVVTRGLPVTGLGDVNLDLDPDGRLMVSNLGSSGCDGVSISLGESEGGELECLDCELLVDSFFDIDIYDDQCPACPTATLASLHVASNPGGEVVLTPDHPSCVSSLNVTLLDGEDLPVGSFTMPSGSSLTVRGAPGESVSMTKVAQRASLPSGSSDVTSVEYVILVTLLSGPTGTPVSVTDPAQQVYAGVDSIVIAAPQCGTDEPTVTRMCMTAANVPSMTLDRIGVVQNGQTHDAEGAARLTAQRACDPATGAPGARMVVDNLGSSGCDGVSIAWSDGDEDSDGLPDNEAIGASFVLDGTNSQDDGVVQTMTWTQTGGPIGGPPSTIGETSLSLVAGERAISVVEPAWLSPAVMDVAILDAQGQVLDTQTGLPVGTAAFLGTTHLPGTYEFEVTVVDTGDDLPIENRNVLKAFFQTGTPRIVGGQPQASGASVEVTVRRTGGGSGGAVFIESSSLRATSSSTTPAQLVVSEQQAIAAIACSADLDGSGDVGFGDILAVIAAWGPCAGCAEDLSGNGAVDFADILAIIAAWGACG